MVKLKAPTKGEPVTKSKLTIDPAVFGYFNNLRSQNQDEKIAGGEKLIQHLTKNPTEDIKEVNYSIKRFIRGLGSASSASRSGFYSTFASYLSVAPAHSVTELLDILAAENVSNNNEEQKMFETYSGNVLVCGSIIRSPLIDSATADEVSALLDHLQKAADAKKVLIPYVQFFLADLIEKVSTDIFEKTVWPVIGPKINIVREKHTLNTAHILMVARTQHPSVITGKLLKATLKTPTFLHPDNFEWFIQLLWNIKSEIKSNHPFYEYFGRQLADSRHLPDFWGSALEKRLSEPHKFNELLTLKLTNTVLQNLSESNQTTFRLVTPNFSKVVFGHLKKATNTTDTLHPLFDEFFKLFLQYCEQIEDGAEKMKAVLQLLFDEHSVVLEDKNLWFNVYNTLITPMDDEQQLKKICERAKQVLTAKTEEDEDAAKAKKLGALNLIKRCLTHKSLTNDATLRLEFMKTFADASIFGEQKSILLREKGINMDQNIRLAFYSLLELKLPRLSDEQQLLASLVQFCDKRIKKTEVLDEESKVVWTKVVQKLSKSQRKAVGDGKINLNALVFEILMLHMALQLFSNPVLARSSIAELESVMERVEAKKKKPVKGKSGENDELEWIEVVVDLFLNLLSQDSSLLRTTITHIFPRLSKDITPTAFNQILSVIDLKENPLIATEKDEDPIEIEDSDDDSDSSDEEDAAANGKAEDGDESSDNDDFLDDSEPENEENQGNITDRVRSVIHAALGTAGAETDTESLDLDDMDVEEGQRVDNALAAAFKLLKSARKTKPTKTDRENDLQLSHFRMRVFDLIESYLKSSPSMACCLELMMFIYEQLPLAIKEPEKYGVILKKFQYIFNSLTRVKSFENCGDVTQAQLASLLSDLFQKVAKGAAFPEKNACLSNSALFIITCSKVLAKHNAHDKDVIRDIFVANLREFFQHRQPTLALNMLEIIFKLPWLVLWDLSAVITNVGLSLEIRNLRRCNSLQLLTAIFKNLRLINADLEMASTKIPAIETSINTYITGLQRQDQVSENEFNELLALLLAINEFHKRLPKITNKLNVDGAKTAIQKFRPGVVLKAQETNVYTRLCKLFEITPCLNKQLAADDTKKVVTEQRLQKADKKAKKRAWKEEKKQKRAETKAKKANSTNGTAAVGESKQKAGEKRKQKVDLKKVKRLKKEERLKASSDGLIENFSFSL